MFLTKYDATAPVLDLPVDRGGQSVACHEASHCALALAAGGRVRSVTIDHGIYFAAAQLPDDAPWRLNVALSLAGDVAGHWSRKWTRPISCADLDWTLDAVRGCGGGYCDLCKALRTATVGLRHPPDAVVIAEIRRIEAATTAFVQTPRNWHFIRRLAAMLIDHGTVTGDEITAEFGAYEFDLSAFAGLDPTDETGRSYG